MNRNLRPSPAIPDHEVLRKIGGGAYGEVWLARGVTGAMRAVKVVRREDFEDDRTFEREFDGILKFEPISRDHPGLVNILHVGRSTGEEEFYYYVMELGDDVESGSEINPIEYEPRTLRGDHQQGDAEPWPTEDCLDIGLRLAEALQHLHDNGLAHRDVKPSNVIFVNGKAKLADIGLVAARGQRTFVGTEGFVPPEGPGSAKADVYSLGKVLYEIATGLDRMNFPELPEEMPSGSERKRWLELNRIICEVCEPRISKRRISTGGELAYALRRLKRGKRRRPGRLSLAMTSLVLLGAAGGIGWQFIKDSDWLLSLQPKVEDPKSLVGLYRIISTPEGADVIDRDGEVIGTTPTQPMNADVGSEISVTLRKEGYRREQVEGIVTMAATLEPLTLHGQLEVFSPPVEGEPWIDHLGKTYQPDGTTHVSSGFVSRALWDEAAKTIRVDANKKVEQVETTENGSPVQVVVTSAEYAQLFCRWFRRQAIDAGYLTEDHEVSARFDQNLLVAKLSAKAQQQGLRPFRLVVNRINYGSVRITTEPPGAELFVNGVSVGVTDGELVVPGLKPGKINLLMLLEGYRPLQQTVELQPGEFLEARMTLRKNQGVVFGREWENGLGMKFVPLGKDLMVSIWETRVKDYRQFTRESRYIVPGPIEFEQSDLHPVVNVSRKDAEAFCKWLTKRERLKERISQNHYYRLPTDLEWSRMVGLDDEGFDASPSARDARKKEVHPWGTTWEESNVAPGNFADMQAALSPNLDVDRTIPGYDDGFAFTAPVGSFSANDLGLYDLSGNVQEWVSDSYSKQADSELGVLRGGGWKTYQVENLYSGSRNAVPPDFADEMYGFRVVLARKPMPASP